MQSHNRYDGVDPYAVLKIRYQAKLLTRCRAFSSSDIEDIEQELMLDLVRRLPSFNLARAGKNTFISRVVENHAASMIESVMAGKRGCNIPHQSLQAPRQDCSDHQLSLDETISTDEGLWDAGSPGWDETADLRRDLARALHRLPPRLASLCRHLSSGTVTQVSRDTGMPRSSIYDAISRIREVLTGADLKIYI